MRSTLVALAGVGATGCGLFPDVNALSSGSDAAPGIDAGLTDIALIDTTPPDTSVHSDAPSDVVVDAASCACDSLVSVYRFAQVSSLGTDSLGNNDLTDVAGTPKQSTKTPSGLSGYSLSLDGSSGLCIFSGFTFDPTSDHTLCWWSQPSALADNTDQFAQTCVYDAWTTNGGTDYRWRINNCNNGTPANLDVPNVYAAGAWVQICQTYESAASKRRVVVGGVTSQAVSTVDPAPIVGDVTAPWCIGSYAGGGYWTGLIYRPMWFDRVLTDAEIAQVATGGCCLTP